MSVADPEFMTENEIFAIVRSKLVEALSTFGVDGFDVRRFAQANFSHGDSLVLMNHIRTVREGWQSAKYRFDGQSLKRDDTWVETHTYQISVLKRMRSDDSESTLTAEDVTTRIISWFNGLGIESFLKDGIQVLLIDPDSIIVYNDDSDLYQRRPVFELRVIVNKKFSTGQDSTDILGVRTKPV